MNRDDAVDILLEPPASVSVYLQALLDAERHREVDLVRRSHRRAAETARAALEHAGVWSSTTEPLAAAPYRYDEQPTRVEIVEHGGDMERGPGLHAHLLVRIPPATRLDRPALERTLPFVRARYERSLTDHLASELGLAMRELDGRQQLAGVPDDLLSSRMRTACRAQVGARQLR